MHRCIRGHNLSTLSPRSEKTEGGENPTSTVVSPANTSALPSDEPGDEMGKEEVDCVYVGVRKRESLCERENVSGAGVRRERRQ